MTWRHIAALLIAAGLVLGCGISHVCSAPGTLQGVITLATAIVGGTFGHAGVDGRRKRKRAGPPP